MDLRTAAAELYRALPTEFMATRTALVKDARADGDRELARAIGALPKPTVAAWAVNLLVRTHHAEVEQLLDVGAQLREAQAALSGQDLRELNKQQHRLLGAVRRQAEAAARQAGQRLSEPIAQRVQATLHAGMADPWAANALRSGALVRELESTGLGPVDLEGAVAVPDASSAGRSVDDTDEAPRREKAARGAKGPRATAGSSSPERTTPTRATAGKERTGDDEQEQTEERARREADERARREADERALREAEERAAREREAQERAAREEAARLRAEAERKLEAAEAAAQEAQAALDEADARLDEVVDERADLATRIAELTKELRTLRDRDREADVHEREARSARGAAARAAAVAERAADRARSALDQLDG